MSQYPLDLAERKFETLKHLEYDSFIDAAGIIESYKQSPWFYRTWQLNQRLATEGEFRYWHKTPLLPDANSFDQLFDVKNITWVDYFKTHRQPNMRIPSGRYLNAPDNLFTPPNDKETTSYVQITDELREAWERVNGPVSGPETVFSLNSVRIIDWDEYWSVWGHGGIVQTLITVIKKGTP